MPTFMKFFYNLCRFPGFTKEKSPKGDGSRTTQETSEDFLYRIYAAAGNYRCLHPGSFDSNQSFFREFTNGRSGDAAHKVIFLQRRRLCIQLVPRNRVDQVEGVHFPVQIFTNVKVR